MLAVEKVHPEICRLLIRAGSDVNHKDRNGLTALHLACETLIKEKLTNKIADMLLENGAQIEDHLLHAIEFGKTETVKRLLAMGAGVEVKDEDGKTPLVLAIQENRVDVMRLLLSRKADVNVRSKDGRTVAHFAASLINPEPMRLLIEHGFDRFNDQDDEGNTAMHYVEAGDCEVLLLMLENDGDINLKNNRGCVSKLYWNRCCKIEFCHTLGFFQHLRVLGYKINEETEEVLTKELYDSDCEKLCKMSVDEMNDIVVNFGKKRTLYDLLFLNKNSLMRYVNNEVVLELWNELDRNYGLYGRILLRRLVKAKKRHELVTKATEMFGEAIGSFFPDHLGEKIFRCKTDAELAVWFPDGP